MTPNYLRSPKISVSPFCDCSNSGNSKDECDKFTKFFTENICLRKFLLCTTPVWSPVSLCSTPFGFVSVLSASLLLFSPILFCRAFFLFFLFSLLHCTQLSLSDFLLTFSPGLSSKLNISHSLAGIVILQHCRTISDTAAQCLNVCLFFCLWIFGPQSCSRSAVTDLWQEVAFS